MLCKYKIRKVEVLFADEELTNKKNPLLQHDEMCRVVANTLSYQMSRLLYVNFSYGNITLLRYGVFFSVCPDFTIQTLRDSYRCDDDRKDRR
jgi:hypothetical protein